MLFSDSLKITNFVSFNSIKSFLQTQGINIKISDTTNLCPFFSIGLLTVSKGNVYAYNIVPNIPLILSFGTLFDLPLGSFIFQYSYFDLQVLSNTSFQIQSQGHKNTFLLGYKNDFDIFSDNFIYWLGGLYTEGHINAVSNFFSLNLSALDKILILGLGTKYKISSQNGHFFCDFTFDVLYFPCLNISENLFLNIDTLFFRKQISQNYENNDSLLLLYPSFNFSYKFSSKKTNPANIKIVLKKAFPVPVLFSNENSNQTNNGNAYSITNLLLTGLHFGIQLTF